MESHIAAKIAARHGVPFAACRVIIDPAERTLPPAALVGMRADGRPDVFAVIRSLCQQPRQVFALLRVVADARAARTALFRGRRRLGENLSFPGGDCSSSCSSSPSIVVSREHYSVSAVLPLNSTGPVGRPVGEPVAGSSVISNN